jgi:hypothetical protein
VQKCQVSPGNVLIAAGVVLQVPQQSAAVAALCGVALGVWTLLKASIQMKFCHRLTAAAASPVIVDSMVPRHKQ